MRLYIEHNNNEALKLAEEGRDHVELIQASEGQTDEFRINVNYEIPEQIIDDQTGTVDWMEELGFYETEHFLISKSIALVNNELIQFRISKTVELENLNPTPNISSGCTFFNVKALLECAEQIVLVQETEKTYELFYLTVYEN